MIQYKIIFIYIIWEVILFRYLLRKKIGILSLRKIFMSFSLIAG